MWSVPRREQPEERCQRLMALYEEQIADLEASRPSPYWDGYCGLVHVCDEDYVRPDSAQNTAAAARAAHAQQPRRQQDAQQQQQAQQQPLCHAHQRNGPRPGTRRPRTPVAGSPRASPGGSPFKPGPGAVPPSQQSAGVLVEQGRQQLQQGRLREAEALLHAALRGCPASDTQLAARCIDLLIDAEREAQETPSHSRAPSDVDFNAEQLAGSNLEGDTGGSGGAGSAAAGAAALLLRAAVEALAAGEERRALSTLHQAADACPPELVELHRRVQLYLELVTSKRRAVAHSKPV